MITPWNCLAVAFANATGLAIETIEKEVGHDGGQILWPENKLPFDRCAFHTQEMIDVCLRYNYAVVTIEVNPMRGNQYAYLEYPVVFSVSNDKRMNRYLKNYNGVLKGRLENGNGHAVAWDCEKQTVVDPSGKVKNISDLTIGWFLIVKPFE